MDHIVLNHQVFVYEIGPVVVIGYNPTYFGRCENDVFGFFLREEAVDGPGIQQIQFIPCFSDQVVVSFGLKIVPDRAADQALVTGDVYFACEVHF